MYAQELQVSFVEYHKTCWPAALTVLPKPVRLVPGVFNLMVVSVSINDRGVYAGSWGEGLGNANDEQSSPSNRKLSRRNEGPLDWVIIDWDDFYYNAGCWRSGPTPRANDLTIPTTRNVRSDKNCSMTYINLRQWKFRVNDQLTSVKRYVHTCWNARAQRFCGSHKPAPVERGEWI